MWFFSYGTSTAPERFQRQHGAASKVKPALIREYCLAFRNFDPVRGGGASCIVPEPSGVVLGTAYLISPEQKEHLGSTGGGYLWHQRRAEIDGEMVSVEILLPPAMGDFACPTDDYIAEIREGLSYFYPMVQVDPYLRKALGREKVFAGMIGRWISDYQPNREYGMEFRRLLPWSGILRAPWGGAWATFLPGEDSELFTHDEEEIALVLTGKGELRVDANKREVRKGDFVYFQPYCEHVIRNTSNEPLEVLFVWWGGQDGAMWAGRKI